MSCRWCRSLYPRVASEQCGERRRAAGGRCSESSVEVVAAHDPLEQYILSNLEHRRLPCDMAKISNLISPNQIAPPDDIPLDVPKIVDLERGAHSSLFGSCFCSALRRRPRRRPPPSLCRAVSELQKSRLLCLTTKERLYGQKKVSKQLFPRLASLPVG